MNKPVRKNRDALWQRRLDELLETRPGVEPRTPAWEVWVRELTTHLGYIICGRKAAPKTDSPHPCIKAPLEGRDCCRNHGGKSIPAGIGHPSLTHGGRSKLRGLIPLHMQASFMEARSDPDRLSLDDEIALTRMRMEELLLRLSTGESGPRWQAARETMRDIRVALAKGDIPSLNAAMTRLDNTINAGVQDESVWGELKELKLTKRRLVDTERKRLEVMNEMIPADRARLMIGTILSIITRHVSDTAALSAISLEVQAMLSGKPQVESEGAAETGEAEVESPALGPGEIAA